MKKIEGIYPALVTPFTGNFKVDEKALAKLIDYLVGKGADGFYLCGSTGEFLLLSLEEREFVTEFVAEYVAGRAKVITHIGCQNTEDTIRLAEHAAKVGVDGISTLPPIYFKYSFDELNQFFYDVTLASDLPLIVYNAPALAGVAFDSQNIRSIFENKKITGIKNTSYDLFQMQRLIENYNDKNIINGHDELYLSTLVLGVTCAIGSTFNFMLPKFKSIRRAFEKGDFHLAGKLQGQANKIIEVLIEVGMFQGIKGILKLIDLDCGECKKPFSPLTADEIKKLELLLPLIFNE